MRLNKRTLILIAIILLAAFLRFYKLSSNPPSLYWEEVALGYDAYSLLKTGKDHRGNSWPVVFINSYMDYKPPLYIYATIPSVWLFGLNEFAARLPSAIAGTLTVLLIYFLTKELFKITNNQSPITNNLPIIASLLLAVSPWHLQFSRAAFEANFALFLVVLAVWLFFKSFKKKFLLPFSALFFALSLYAYHGARVFVPLLVFVLAVLFAKKLFENKINVIVAVIFGLILAFPLLSSLKNKEIRQRFQETSVFTTLDPIIESNLKIQQGGGGLLARLIYHRYWEYLRIFLEKYFQHFNGSYLFLSGDNNPRHSTGEFGLFYHWELITLILGLAIFLKNPKKEHFLLLTWVFIGIIPAAITKATPHALRTLFALPAYIMISSVGLVYLISARGRSAFGGKLLNNNKIIVSLFYCFIVLELILYLHFYHHHYPRLQSFHWQYGYKQAVFFARENESNYDNIWLTNTYGRSYMYFLFFQKIDPAWVQKEINLFKRQPEIPKIGKYYFGSNLPIGGKNLYIAGPGEAAMRRKSLLKTIDFLNNERAFEIWESK